MKLTYRPEIKGLRAKEKVLIIGGNSQIGSELYSYLKKKAANINLNYALPIIFLIIALGLSFNSGTSGKFIYFDF